MLINRNAIALTRANAFAAAKVVAGPGTSVTTLYKIADDYLKFVIPRANQALYTPQIVHDVNFANIVAQNKESKTDSIMGAASSFFGGFGLTDSAIGGIPNWALLGGVAAGGYYLYKRKKKGKKGKSKRKSSRRKSAVASFIPSGRIGA